VQCLAQQALEALDDGLLVLVLAAAAGVGEEEHALGVDPAGELLEHARALRLAEAGGRRDAPRQLDARRRGVDVLTSRAPGAAGPEVQLELGDEDVVGDPQDAVVRSSSSRCQFGEL
jgi:hypothetical protein